MERILIPTFLVCKKDREVFNNVDLFRGLVGQIADFTRGGNTSIKEVMKTLSYLKVAKGLPALNEMFAFMKVYVFDLYKNEESSNNNARGQNSASVDTYSKVLNTTAFKDLDRQRCFLEITIKRHMDLIKELQAINKKGLVLQEKRRQWQEKLQKKLPRADGEKRGTKKEIISLEKKLSMNGEMLDMAYLSYQSVLELEKFTRREMQQLSKALQQQIVAMTREKLTESFDLLDEMAWSNKLSMYVLEKVRAIDCQYAAEQLYKQISQAYMFPDPVEWNSRTGFNAKLEDPVILSSDYCLNKGEYTGLVDVEEPDEDLENRPEEIYVKAVANCNNGTDSSLAFKRGKIFKQKLVSRDGTIGFGWKRSSIAGMKVWGFYYVCMVKFDH